MDRKSLPSPTEDRTKYKLPPAKKRSPDETERAGGRGGRGYSGGSGGGKEKMKTSSTQADLAEWRRQMLSLGEPATKKRKLPMNEADGGGRGMYIKTERESEEEENGEAERGSWEEDLMEIARFGEPTRSRLKIIFARQDYKNDAVCNGRNVWPWNKAPLHSAAMQGKKTMVKVLVEEAAFDVNSFRQDANVSATPLHLAVSSNNTVNPVTMVRLLLDLGANPELEGRWGRFSGTSLDWAREKGDPMIIMMLEDHLASLKKEPKCEVPTEEPLTFDSLVYKLKSRDSTEIILEEAVGIQEKIFNLGCKEAHLDAKLYLAKTKFEKVEKELQEKFEAEKKAIKEKYETEKKLLENARDRVFKNVSDLKKLTNFKTKEEIDKIKAEQAKLSSWKDSLKDVVAPNMSDVKSCPICANPPSQVFSCAACHESWFCDTCRGQFDNCPNCRQEFKEMPPIRNKIAEALLRKFSF